MKHRFLSLLLCLCLLCGLLVLPAEAATPKDVYQKLKSIALSGYHDTDAGCWCDNILIDESSEAYYGVYYWEKDYEVEVTIFTDVFEVTLILPPAMSMPYTAYMTVYDSKNTTGTVKVPANYNGGSFSSFSSFSGDSSLKSDMLNSLSTILPLVIEYTRAFLLDFGYTLRDLGFTAYSKCSIHVWDDGVLIKAPTCSSTGLRRYTCRICGTTADEETPTDGNAHSWGDPFVLTPASCTEDGTTRYTCTLCHYITKDEPIPALGHVWAPTETVTQGETLHESTEKYTCSRCGESKEARLCAGEIFTDMPKEGSFAHGPIDWAYFHEPQITAGVTNTTFAPNAFCTRAQVVTFLWRVAGKPELAEDETPQVRFTDVNENGYYYKAMLWAIKNGITYGMSDTTFCPNANCTRAQVVTFLWRAAGQPELAEQPEVKFTDVNENGFYYTPMLWAIENNVTNGMSIYTFAPNSECNRAQVVTFLWRSRDLFAQPEDPIPEEPEPEEPEPEEPEPEEPNPEEPNPEVPSSEG